MTILYVSPAAPRPVVVNSTTGDVLFTTTGLGAAGDTYNIVMRMKKHYA